MKIGRFQNFDESRFWGVFSETQATVRRLEEPFATWAPRLALADDPSEVTLGTEYRFADLTLLAPVEPGARIFGTGINYGSHLLDSGRPDAAHPPTPPGYFKLDSTVVHPGGEIRYPTTTDSLDYEVELVGVVAMAVDPQKGHRSGALLGYTIGNDVCHRDTVRTDDGSPMTELYSLKTLDQTAPIGPWITTLGELGGVGQPDLRISQKINGALRQDDRTGTMHLGVDQIMAWVNARNRLRPGDLFFTGTVGGVGMLSGQFLKPGDTLEASIEGIGVLTAYVGPQYAPQ